MRHCYFGIENLALNPSQRQTLVDALRQLGPEATRQPAHQNELADVRDRLYPSLNREGLYHTFLVWLIGGLWSVAYDADHFIAPVRAGLWPAWDTLGGRPLHLPVLAALCVVCGLGGALLAGFWAIEMIRFA